MHLAGTIPDMEVGWAWDAGVLNAAKPAVLELLAAGGAGAVACV